MSARALEHVGLVGLGAMGRPMAATLLRAGFELSVFDVRPGAADELRGAQVRDTPAAVARDADAVVLMVQNFGQVRGAVWGDDGVLGGLAAGSLLVLSSTVAPADARVLAAACEERGVNLLDAPVSGGPGPAAEGRLAMMVGGPAEALAQARPILDALGDPARTWHVGLRVGDGQAMKMINQLMAGVNIAASCEAMTLAARAGLDPAQTYEIVRGSAGGSWMFGDRVPRMLDGGFTPPRSVLDIFVKDLGIVVDTADDLGLPLFLAAVARQVFKMGAATGLGGEDDAGLVRVYERLGGVQVGPRENDAPHGRR